MLYAQFYQRGVMTNALIEGCGDRAVIILDARHNLKTNLEIARSECLQRKYEGFSLHRGETFTRSHQVTELETI